jgi:hypothetical protein
METLFSISLDGVVDINGPFTYWFMMYLDEESYQADVVTGYPANVFDLSTIMTENMLKTPLP